MTIDPTTTRGGRGAWRGALGALPGGLGRCGHDGMPESPTAPVCAIRSRRAARGRACRVRRGPSTDNTDRTVCVCAYEQLEQRGDMREVDARGGFPRRPRVCRSVSHARQRRRVCMRADAMRHMVKCAGVSHTHRRQRARGMWCLCVCVEICARACVCGQFGQWLPRRGVCWSTLSLLAC